LAVSAGPDNGQFVSDEAWQAADWLNVMAYDGQWGHEARSPHSSYAFTRSALDYWLEVRQLPVSKVVIGVPFYGRSLIDRHSRTYRSLLEQFPEAATADAAGGFNYNGPDTMRAKVVNQARLRAGGVMIWQLNQDARGASSLLSLIYETVKEPVEE
jgi:spore germination protein YaaH